MSLPIGRMQGLPVGGQIIASHFDEYRMFAAAYALERALVSRAIQRCDRTHGVLGRPAEREPGDDVEHAHPHDAPSFGALFLGEIRMRREIKRFRRTFEPRAIAAELRHHVIELAAERATLVRRIAYLKKTKMLFDVWHVFHMPLVYIMFVIVLMHVAVTMYMGYVPFMD